MREKGEGVGCGGAELVFHVYRVRSHNDAYLSLLGFKDISTRERGECTFTLVQSWNETKDYEKQKWSILHLCCVGASNSITVIVCSQNFG